MSKKFPPLPENLKTGLTEILRPKPANYIPADRGAFEQP